MNTISSESPTPISMNVSVKTELHQDLDMDIDLKQDKDKEEVQISEEHVNHSGNRRQRKIGEISCDGKQIKRIDEDKNKVNVQLSCALNMELFH